MPLDDAEIKAIQQFNKAMEKMAADLVLALYKEAAGKPVIACGQCHETTATATARAKIIPQDTLFGDSVFPEITQLKMALVCPRCFDLR